mmetsp:Transcript_76233/g.193450  ORF Transcript_76233/g.193450 Transcript_76233/m.193450 type:complete len:227 (-) Transcript_76233:95-775(-)
MLDHLGRGPAGTVLTWLAAGCRVGVFHRWPFLWCACIRSACTNVGREERGEGGRIRGIPGPGCCGGERLVHGERRLRGGFAGFHRRGTDFEAPAAEVCEVQRRPSGVDQGLATGQRAERRGAVTLHRQLRLLLPLLCRLGGLRARQVLRSDLGRFLLFLALDEGARPAVVPRQNMRFAFAARREVRPVQTRPRIRPLAGPVVPLLQRRHRNVITLLAFEHQVLGIL